jgi:hypothetical protein
LRLLVFMSVLRVLEKSNGPIDKVDVEAEAEAVHSDDQTGSGHQLRVIMSIRVWGLQNAIRAISTCGMHYLVPWNTPVAW